MSNPTQPGQQFAELQSGGGATSPGVTVDPALLQQQQAFVNAMQTQAAGGGPSVATQMLRNNQQQQAAATNAQISGARGVNAGMALRQGLQANAAANQTTAGQAAVARDQEQLQAQQTLAGQLNQMQSQNLGAQQATQQGSLAAEGINAQLAQGNANANQAGIGGVLNGVGAALGAGASLLARGGEVKTPIKMAQGGDFSVSPIGYNLHPQMPIAPTQNPYSNGLNSLGKGAKSLYNALTPNPASAVDSTPQLQMPEMGAQYSGQSPSLNVGDNAGSTNGPSLGVNTNLGSSPITDHLLSVAPGNSQDSNIFGVTTPPLGLARGGYVSALVSPGERYIPPTEVKKIAAGIKNPMKAGTKIPGKPRVAGAHDSYANDTVPRTLKEGGIVLPRHITQAPDAPARAARFVQAVLAKRA